MSTIRPPFFTKGQANDGYTYASLGIGLFWLAGGVAAGPAAAALALCGAGFALNNANVGRNSEDPKLVFLPKAPTLGPPDPLTNQTWTNDDYTFVQDAENRLLSQYGQNAVYCFRQMVLEGHSHQDAFAMLSHVLEELVKRNKWRNGFVQSNGQTPKRILDELFGRRVASPELESWISSDGLREYYQYQCGRTDDYLTLQYVLTTLSMIVYILGLEPICDKPVRRIKWWTKASHRKTVFYVSDWTWFTANSISDFRYRWRLIIDNRLRAGMPKRLEQEAEDLFDYRVEEHNDPDTPPCRSDGFRWKNVLFDNESYPATEENMMGVL